MSSDTPSIPVPKQTLVKQTLDRTNHGQVQTLERYKPWVGMNPGQV